MQQLLETVQYRASANTRVPLFTESRAGKPRSLHAGDEPLLL
jgi:hypothetical protein